MRGEPAARIAETREGKAPDTRFGWTAIGMVLVAIHCVLVPLSGQFDYDAPPRSYPVILFVALEVLAGAVYAMLLWLIPRSRPEGRLLVLVLGVGLAMRVATMASTPILEDDYYRYLWDGAVVAAGSDPYRQSPAQVLAAADAGSASELSELVAIARASGSVARRVNYPQLTTVYPPLAEAAFAAGAAIEAFSLTAWRMIVLLFDGATLLILYLVLVRLNRSSLWLAIYWWNPLVVKELINSAHMDALLLPVLTSALLMLLHGRRLIACGGLALAAGIKLWPVLLVPTALRDIIHRPRRLLGAIGIFLLTFSGTAWWLCRQWNGTSGLSVYASTWNMNDAFFLAFHWVVEKAMTALGLVWIDGEAVSRVILGTIVLWLAVWLNRHPTAGDADEICRRFMIITAAVFLLSPAQFPWYYLWLVPFLTITPSAALLMLTVLLPLYYLRFYLDFRDQSRLFDYGIVWMEYLPVWILLAREWWVHGRRGMSDRPELGRT